MTVTCPLVLWVSSPQQLYTPVIRRKEREVQRPRAPDPPLTKADRFPLVFRVSIVSSTIWNRLQCGGPDNNKAFTLTVAPWSSSKVPEDGSVDLPPTLSFKTTAKLSFRSTEAVTILPDDPDQVQDQPNNFPSVWLSACFKITDAALTISLCHPSHSYLVLFFLQGKRLSGFGASVGQRLCCRHVCVIVFLIF